MAGAVSEQLEVDPAAVGAEEVAEVGLSTTSAVSVAPVLSVTTSCTVARPQEGAVTVAVLLLALVIVTLWPPMLDHA